MEFYELILVAVFLLVFVVFLLAYFVPVYTKEESISYWVGQDIGIEPNYKVVPGKAELTIKNNWGYEVRILDITFDGKGGIKEINLKNGEVADVEVLNIPKCVPGVKYSYKVSILYQDVRTGRNFLLEGKVPLVGICEKEE
jgi:hypothetical protein